MNHTEKIRNFRDLEVWKLGKKIGVQIYKHTQHFPKEEVYGLTSQMRRAACSIPSNIAEGFNRYHNKEYKYFLFVALGSCAELETQVEISCEMNYLTATQKRNLDEYLDHEQRMIRNLIKKL